MWSRRQSELRVWLFKILYERVHTDTYKAKKVTRNFSNILHNIISYSTYIQPIPTCTVQMYIQLRSTDLIVVVIMIHVRTSRLLQEP